MLERIDSPDTVLAVEVVGKLEKEDYQRVLVPGLRALLDGPGEIRCVFVFGDNYSGLTVGREEPRQRGGTEPPRTGRPTGGNRSGPTGARRPRERPPEKRGTAARHEVRGFWRGDDSRNRGR